MRREDTNLFTDFLVRATLKLPMLVEPPPTTFTPISIDWLVLVSEESIPILANPCFLVEYAPHRHTAIGLTYLICDFYKARSSIHGCDSR